RGVKQHAWYAGILKDGGANTTPAAQRVYDIVVDDMRGRRNHHDIGLDMIEQRRPPSRKVMEETNTLAKAKALLKLDSIHHLENQRLLIGQISSHRLIEWVRLKVWKLRRWASITGIDSVMENDIWKTFPYLGAKRSTVAHPVNEIPAVAFCEAPCHI